MANPGRRFEVIEGGTSRPAQPPLVDTGVVGRDKAEFKRPKPSSGGGRGGGTQAVRLATLEQSVGWLWKSVGAIFTLGLAAIIASYLLLADRIDDRHQATSSKLDVIARDISRDISDLRVAVVEARHANEHQPSVGEIRQPVKGDDAGRRP